MKKLAMILMGCFLFLAGLFAGSLLDSHRAEAVSYTREYGVMVLPHGYYKVEWNGSTVDVWSGNSEKYPVMFNRSIVDGKVNLYGLRARK